jgi:hypothetical protein
MNSAVPATTPFNATTPDNSTSHVNSTQHHEKKEDETEKKVQKYSKWILDNYDANKDSTLD